MPSLWDVLTKKIVVPLPSKWQDSAIDNFVNGDRNQTTVLRVGVAVGVLAHTGDPLATALSEKQLAEKIEAALKKINI